MRRGLNWKGAAPGALLLFLAGAAVAAEARLLAPPPGVAAGGITALAAAGERLFAGTREQGIVAYDTATGTSARYTRNEGLPSDRVRSLAVFRGKVYAGTSEGIGVFDGKRWTGMTEAGGVAMRNVVLAASPSERELWACSMTLNGGTVRFDGAAWTFMGGEGRGLFNDISSFAFPEDGVAMGSQAGAVYLRRGAEVEALGRSFPTVTVFALSERGGTLYAGTSGGLYVWRGAGWTPALVPPAFEGKAVFCLLRVDLDMVVAGLEGVAVLDRSGRQRVVSGVEGFPRGPARALAARG